ncbi:unnamed protein product, partial [Pylaiella littoralis]
QTHPRGRDAKELAQHRREKEEGEPPCRSPASTSERRQRADGQTHDHFAWQGPTRR